MCSCPQSLSYSGRCIGRVSVSVPVSRFALSGRASVSGRVLVSVPVTFRLVSRSAVSGRVVSRSCRDPFSTVFLVDVSVVFRSVSRRCLGRVGGIPVGVSAGVPVVSWSLFLSFRGRRSGLVPWTTSPARGGAVGRVQKGET